MDKIIGTHQKANKQTSEHWVSLSDLMAGLMIANSDNNCNTHGA